jgi:hypothetical protein
VNLAALLLSGTFEHAVDHLLDQAIDLTRFDVRFRNDTTGAPAYPPAVLLKVVLCAYARGIVSSRTIARLCEDHATFIALCGACRPHFTTIAAFVSGLGVRQSARLRRDAGGVRAAGPDRRREVRHRWGEAAEQRVEGTQREARGLRTPGREAGGRRRTDAHPASGHGRVRRRT